jgi:hypothetical protein
MRDIRQMTDAQVLLLKGRCEEKVAKNGSILRAVDQELGRRRRDDEGKRSVKVKDLVPLIDKWGKRVDELETEKMRNFPADPMGGSNPDGAHMDFAISELSKMITDLRKVCRW